MKKSQFKSGTGFSQPKFLKAAVYGANDGIITTFAVVAGVAGAGLSTQIVLILGLANVMADGISMGLGDYLGERTAQRLTRKQGGAEQKHGLWMTGMVTFLAFVTAGMMPLAPYFWVWMSGTELKAEYQFPTSIAATASTLFLVGAARTWEIDGKWWRNGLEMLGIGAAAAIAAYGLGSLVQSIV
jgi:vacuolar iron transporter family protein